MQLRLSLCTPLLLAAALSAQQVRTLTPAAPGGSSPARSAQAEIEALMHAARTGDAVAFWEWLPNSYQRDVEGLFHDLADRIDAKVYAQSLQLAGRIARVALDKQEFFFTNDMVARSLARSPETVRPSHDTYRAVMMLLGDIGGSDLATVEGLRNFDGAKFLQASGKTMLQGLFAVSRSRGHDPLAQLEGASVKTLEQKGDKARLEMRSAAKATEVEDYVRVEGHWLPVKLVRDWSGAMQQARSKIAALPVGGDKKLMAQARFMIGTIEGLVRRFEDAETQEEFDSAMDDVMALQQRGANHQRMR